MFWPKTDKSDVKCVIEVVCDRSTSSVAPDRDFIACDGCRRSFSRPQDKARHSFSSVRLRRAAGSMNVSVSCCQCQRTFRRPQDMARHKCSRSGRV